MNHRAEPARPGRHRAPRQRRSLIGPNDLRPVLTGLKLILVAVLLHAVIVLLGNVFSPTL